MHVFILNRTAGFSLNNDDALILKDLTGETIDSVAYSFNWHHPDVVDITRTFTGANKSQYQFQ